MPGRFQEINFTLQNVNDEFVVWSYVETGQINKLKRILICQPECCLLSIQMQFQSHRIKTIWFVYCCCWYFSREIKIKKNCLTQWKIKKTEKIFILSELNDCLEILRLLILFFCWKKNRSTESIYLRCECKYSILQRIQFACT